MYIYDDSWAELTMQDIINTNSARAAEISLNTTFDIKSITNFYSMGSSSSLTCHYFKEHKNFSIENNTSQSVDDLTEGKCIRL